MVIHLLDQQHLLHVDDPVSEYIPEFGKHGKERITIEHVLTHRAGIPNMPPEEMNLENLAHPERIVADAVRHRSRPGRRDGGSPTTRSPAASSSARWCGA